MCLQAASCAINALSELEFCRHQLWKLRAEEANLQENSTRNPEKIMPRIPPKKGYKE